MRPATYSSFTGELTVFQISMTTKSRRLSYAVFVSALLALSSMLSIVRADGKDVHELEIGYIPI